MSELGFRSKVEVIPKVRCRVLFSNRSSGSRVGFELLFEIRVSGSGLDSEVEFWIGSRIIGRMLEFVFRLRVDVRSQLDVEFESQINHQRAIIGVRS